MLCANLTHFSIEKLTYIIVKVPFELLLAAIIGTVAGKNKLITDCSIKFIYRDHCSIISTKRCKIQALSTGNTGHFCPIRILFR